MKKSQKNPRKNNSRYYDDSGSGYHCVRFLESYPYPKDIFPDEDGTYRCKINDIADNDVLICCGDWIVTSDNGANIVVADDLFCAKYFEITD